MKEYEIIAQFTQGPMAGNIIKMDWLGHEPLKVGKSVNHGEHKFKVLECTEVVFDSEEE
jgi:hypothetical protein